MNRIKVFFCFLLITCIFSTAQEDWNSLCEEDVARTTQSACLEYYDAMKPKVISLFTNVESC